MLNEFIINSQVQQPEGQKVMGKTSGKELPFVCVLRCDTFRRAWCLHWGSSWRLSSWVIWRFWNWGDWKLWEPGGEKRTHSWAIWKFRMYVIGIYKTKKKKKCFQGTLQLEGVGGYTEGILIRPLKELRCSEEVRKTIVGGAGVKIMSGNCFTGNEN